MLTRYVNLNLGLVAGQIFYRLLKNFSHEGFLV